VDQIDQALQRALIVRCQLDDRRAMEELFLRHNRALHYYLQRMLNLNEVEDVQQEVWLSVIRHIGQLRNPEAFIVWLYQIARRKVVARMAELRPTISLDDHDVAEEVFGDIEPAFSATDAAQIHEELVRLSAKHREVLLLRFMEDLSYEQIAKVIECTAGTVRSRLHYAKLALRQRLEGKSCPNQR